MAVGSCSFPLGFLSLFEQRLLHHSLFYGCPCAIAMYFCAAEERCLHVCATSGLSALHCNLPGGVPSDTADSVLTQC